MIRINDSGYNVRFHPTDKKVGRKYLFKSVDPNFQGKVPQIPSGSLRDAIEYILPNSTKMLKILGSNGGEIQNIIINAMGTGLVAPIFIKYNFLSEADNDTRTYSAWRQPVSAVLAVLTQAGLTAPFYKIFDNWANNGTFGEALNKTPFLDEYYINNILKKKYPNATRNQISSKVKEIKSEQRKNLLRTIEEKNTVIYTHKDGSKLRISDEKFRNTIISTIDKLAQADQKALNKIEETVAKRVERGIYYSFHYDEADKFLKEFYTQIANARTYSDINGYMNHKISYLKANKAAKELLDILEEVKCRAKVISNGRGTISFSDVQQALLEKVKKMQDHAHEYSQCKSKEDVIKYVERLVSKEKSKLESAMEFYNFLKTQVSEKTNVKDLRQQINSKSKMLKIQNSGLNKNFTEEFANQLINKAKTNMKWYKQFVGIFVSLSILPFTCTLLNWIYPRFMDAFFPNLSSKKHKQESAKLIKQAPVKHEAQTNSTSINSFKIFGVQPNLEVHNG